MTTHSRDTECLMAVIEALVSLCGEAHDTDNRDAQSLIEGKLRDIGVAVEYTSEGTNWRMT